MPILPTTKNRYMVKVNAIAVIPTSELNRHRRLLLKGKFECVLVAYEFEKKGNTRKISSQ